MDYDDPERWSAVLEPLTEVAKATDADDPERALHALHEADRVLRDWIDATEEALYR